MEKLVITGGAELSGEVSISGAKNSAVAILAASILVKGVCYIDNVPRVSDIYVLLDIIEGLGGKAKFVSEDAVEIDCTMLNRYDADFDAVRRIRASSYLMGALLGRFKKARVGMPGGCNFGVRPIDQHIKGFSILGAKENESAEDLVDLSAEKLIGDRIYLDVVSVGATINIMLAAVLAEGTTVIESAAKEPHVVDVANFLNLMGANIKGAGTDVIRIYGVEELHGGEFSVIPDQIEAGTFMIAAAATHGDVTVTNIIPQHMESLSAKLKEMGVNVSVFDDAIRVYTDGNRLKSTNVKTQPHPGFPTDLQPQIVTLLSVADGTSLVTENVWDSRFMYIDQLIRMGAGVSVDGKIATIEGCDSLKGANVSATDLRAGAALVIAGLMADGVTEIDNIHYIDRGYEDLESKFRSLGAKITRVAE